MAGCIRIHRVASGLKRHLLKGSIHQALSLKGEGFGGFPGFRAAVELTIEGFGS